MRHRLIFLTLSCALTGCWGDPTPRPEGVVAAPKSTFEGTWRLDTADAEGRRLAALAELVAGRPMPTDPRRTPEDLAYLSWAANVLGRPATDPERLGLERFVRDVPVRRLVVGAGTLTVRGVDGDTTRAWRLVEKRDDPTHGQVWALELGEVDKAEPAVVAFRDDDHLVFGPAGTSLDAALAGATRWVRVPSEPTP